jgi:hypothetical protein
MEVLRFLAISILAPTCGIATYLASDFLFPEADFAASFADPLLGLALPWVFAIGFSVVLGMVLHFAIAGRNIALGTVFVLFVTASAAATCLFFLLLHGVTNRIFLLSFGTSISAWAMYCFGPLKLWQSRAIEA